MKLREKDLYLPLKEHLEHQGYHVRAEVADCDVVAKKDDEIVLIELKTSFSVKLLAQAVDRQTISESVYVAIPFFPGKKRRGEYRGMCRILKKLSLGLILVHFLKTKTRIEIVFHPAHHKRRKNTKKIKDIIREFNGRLTSHNSGGTTSKEKKMTLYRQEAIRIAVLLDKQKESSPKALMELGAADNTGSILYHNYYGWFEHVKRGVYRLHPHGRQCIRDYPELLKLFNTVSE